MSDHEHPSPEVLPDRSPIGSVMIEIGGDIGAAVVWTPIDLAGEEIEIRRAGAEWDGTHVAVLERETADGVAHAALFASFPAGAYELRLRPARPNGEVVPLEVVGAEVVEITWPTA